MPPVRTFVAEFDLRDRLSAKYDALVRKMSAFTDKPYVATVDFEDTSAGQALDAIQKKAEAASGAVGNKVGKSAEKAGGELKKTASAAKSIGEEAQKSTNLFGSMQSKLEGIGGTADKLRSKFTAITGLLAGGAIGGISWLKAEESSKFAEAVYRKLDRKHIDTSAVKKFVDEAAGSGYTTSSTRLRIVDDLMSRTRLRGAKAEETTESIEKLFFQNRAYLQEKGVSSAQELANMLTKTTLARGEKLLLKDIGISGTSVQGRLSGVRRLAKDIKEEEITKEDPYQVFLNRMSETSKKVGKTLIEPMNAVLEKVNGIIDLIDKIPGAPRLIALATILLAVAGGASLLLTLLSPLILAFGFLKAAMFGQAVAANATATANTALAVSEGGAAAGAWAMAGGLWAAIAPLLLIGLPLITLGAALYMVERRTHIFSNALKTLGKTQMAKDLFNWFKDVGYWINVAIKAIDSLYKMLKTPEGMKGLKLGLGAALGPAGFALGAAGKDPGEALESISEYTRGLLRDAVRTSPYFSKIHEVLKKALAFIGWLYSLWQSFWSWIVNAIPGVRKEIARQELEKDVAKVSDKADDYDLRYNRSTRSFWTRRTDVPGTAEREIKSERDLADVVGSVKASKLWKKKRDYESLPGFGEGIAEAVREGLSGLTIKGIDELTKAINDLIAKLPDPAMAVGNVADNANKAWAPQANENAAAMANANQKGIPVTSVSGNTWSIQNSLGFIPQVMGFDVGGTVKKSGVAVVHEGEILPAAQASKGPGVLAKSIELLDNIMSGRGMARAAGVGGDVHIHLHSSYDFSGMRINSNVDLRKELKQSEDRSVKRSVDEVKRVIGQRRT